MPWQGNLLRAAGEPFAGESAGCAIRYPVALYHHVRVGARPSEAAHAGERRAVGGQGPAGCRRSDLQGQPLPVDRRRRAAEIQVFRDDAMPHGQQHLHHPGDAGRRFQVAKVRLHGADEQRALRVAVPAVRRGHGAQLDRVAHGRSGAVRLHVVHL